MTYAIRDTAPGPAGAPLEPAGDGTAGRTDAGAPDQDSGHHLPNAAPLGRSRGVNRPPQGNPAPPARRTRRAKPVTLPVPAGRKAAVVRPAASC